MVLAKTFLRELEPEYASKLPVQLFSPNSRATSEVLA